MSEPSRPSATVVADSISPEGVRLVTMQVVFHRFVLAEMNTHRSISKNSASSRAIPVSKQLARVRTDPAMPISWPAEHKGMQGGTELDEEASAEVRYWWKSAARDAITSAEANRKMGLHKSVVNRLLEPFMWHTAVMTATAWQNFFDQRCSPLAQPEIRAAAEAVRDAMDDSEPVLLKEGEWHLPYILSGDWSALLERTPLGVSMYPQMVKVSAARCARVSYLTQDGKRDLDADLTLYERLVTAQPPHWSPLEHVATPWPSNRQGIGSDPLWMPDGRGNSIQVPTGHLPRMGNLLGWRSLRTEVEARQGVVTYR